MPVPLLDQTGFDVLVTVIKATFELDARGEVHLADEQAPIRVVDELHDPESPHSSLRFSADIVLEKCGCDVVVIGDAVAPKPAPYLLAGVRVRDRMVTLHAYGPRVYYDALLSIGVGPSEPVSRVPITYERAYGGASSDHALVDWRNPSGVGVATASRALVDQRAPQLEHPGRPHRSSLDRHAPVGFGPIPPHWLPRREYAGTFDDRWQATRLPLFPADYDPRFGNCAHPDLQFETHLRAGEAIDVIGMSLSPLRFAVPNLPLEVVGRYSTGERMAVMPVMDTIVILPERRRVELVFRTAHRLGRSKRKLRELVVRNHA